MRASNKSSIITGAVLLLLAALFTISLILLPLDYGVAGPGHNNIFYLLGDMLYSVYGFCSILIPGFLFVSGLSCFAAKWTARKTLRLLTALIPFFTCVVTESIIRSVVKVDHSPFAIVKILIALVTGAMLVVIEFLGTGIIADRLNKGGFKNLKKKAAPKADSIDKPDLVDESELSLSEDFDKTDASAVSADSESSEEIVPEFKKLSKLKVPKESFFDKLKNKFKKSHVEDDSDDDEIAVKKATVFDEILDEAKDYVSEEAPEESDKPAAAASSDDDEVYALAKLPGTETSETQKSVEPAAEAESPAEAPSPTITHEEFAALTAPDDELEWTNLPPQPENLPPEYDADFDENDPALDFPPKELEIESVVEPEVEVQPQPAVTAAPVVSEAPAAQETPAAPAESAVPEKAAPVRYTDSVVENPLYPHKIVIDDGSELPEEKNDDAAQPAAEKPKYPTRIQLQDENDFEANPEPAAPKAKAEDNSRSVGSYFQDDVVAPTTASKENLYNYFENIDSSKTIPTIEDPYQAENKKKPIVTGAEPQTVSAASDTVNSQFFSQLEEQEKQVSQQKEPEEEVNISTAAASVFADMDADIRKNTPVKNPQAAAKAAGGDSHGRQTGATNLTKDELSDFFNAQQEENTPHTKEIAANPPRTNRATKKGPYVIPSDLLTAYKDDQYWIIDDATKQASLNLKQTLAEFNIEADIIGIKKGPVVTMFEILPAPGVKLSKIVALQDNIALSLAAQSVRIVAPIPGKQAVGIEVPNRNRSVVGFREIIEMDLPEWKKMAVPVVLGKDILGKAQLIDLVKTPHMLIAGATGSGKSVCVNSLILSILYKRSFEDVKMILVDPKVVELKLYNNIPHLLTPVITEPKKALQALQWCLCEMERRYALLDGMGVRDISNYNVKIKEQKICTQKLPYIVVIIDEFADLMATSGKELENIVARLTAMSRAVGIHLVLATQRPSVNVITGLIKANIPTRIAFMVASRTDSNIIIDTVGAEKLLGRGDMLYASAVDPAPIRIQGTFVSDQEVENVVTAVKDYGEPDYIDEEIFVEDDDEEGARDLFGEPMDDDDPLYDQALEIVVQSGKASASYIQRRLKIGYNRAARLVEEMEERGIVGPANGSKPREVIHVP